MKGIGFQKFSPVSYLNFLHLAGITFDLVNDQSLRYAIFSALELLIFFLLHIVHLSD